MQPPNIHYEYELDDGRTAIIRTIRPDDAEIEQDFVQRLSPRSKRLRFMSAIRELSPTALAKFVQIDYPREMALIATVLEDGVEREIGVARYAQDSKGGPAEFAVVVADDWQGRGVATGLLRTLFETGVDAGLDGVEGLVLAENHGMLRLARELGFSIEPYDVGLFRAHKALNSSDASSVAG